MLPQNLLLPLLGLGLYTQCNNINLANNTSIMIIFLALLIEQNKIDALCTAQAHDNNHATNVYAQPYGQAYFAPAPVFYDNNSCGCGCQNNTPYDNYPPHFYGPYYGNRTGYHNCGYNTCNTGYSNCGCGCHNNVYTTSRCGCGTNIY